MVAHLSISGIHPQPRTTVFCRAKAMEPGQRRELALHGLAGTATISRLAIQNQVSRKFVSQQLDTAQDALQQAFAPKQDEVAKALFYIPVTKQWLEQVILGLTLTCHSAIRGVCEFCHDLLDYPISIATVHNVLQNAVQQAHSYNYQQNLSGVCIGAHDEIFQSGRPVLVGADVRSTYCYLLSLEQHRDADTWGIRLLELQDQGFRPEATIADAGSGLRAGQALAMPGTPCRGDVFHASQLVQRLVTSLENRAYEAIGIEGRLEQKKARCRWRGQRVYSVSSQLSAATKVKAKAIDLAADVAALADWLRRDILSLAGPSYATRCELYDFVVAELRAREPLCAHGIGPVVRALSNQRDDLLAFAAQLDQDLAAMATKFQVPVATLREVFNNEILDVDNPLRWSRDAALRERLGSRFFAVSVAVGELAEHTVRASSVIENLNSRLRNYFFLRRHLGPDYLALLQFFLNHRRFLRSQRPERVGKSPAELLTGQPHPHWLEMLGYQRFSRN